MIDFSSKTYESIMADLLSRVSEDLDKRELSLIRTALMPAAKELAEIYVSLDTLQSENFILTATGTQLDQLVLLRGITRREATKAVRKCKFNMAIPKGTRFGTKGDNSIIYETIADAVLDGSYYVANAECTVAGTQGNTYYGDLLPTLNITGLTYAYMTDVEIPGTDDESDLSLRTRYLSSLGGEDFGGNISSYRTYTLGISGVGGVQVYPHYDGAGTVLLSIIDSDLNRATSTLITTVQNTICPPADSETEPSELGYGKAPIGAKVNVVTATNKVLNLTFKVTLEAGMTPSSIQSQVEAVYEAYLLSVRQSWGNALVSNTISYPVNVYGSRLVSKLLEISGVLNITNLLFGDGTTTGGDWSCTETSALQELPVKGTVVITQV